MGKQLTHEEFMQRFAERNPHSDSIAIIGQYTKTNEKLLCRCKVCCFEWKVKPNNLISNSSGCPNCNNKDKVNRFIMSHEDFIEKVSKIRPDIIILSQYKGRTKPVHCKCKTCDNEWNVMAKNILSEGSGCHRCANLLKGKSVMLSHGEFVKRFKENNPNKNTIEIIGTYRGMSNDIECKCSVCNQTWNGNPYSLLKCDGCPICSHHRIIEGVNDFNSLRPDLIKYIMNPKETSSLPLYSATKVKCKCPLCGYEKPTALRDLASNGFSCNVCKDKSCSFPNRFALAFLRLLPLENLISEYSPDWIKPKRFDYYFEYNGSKYILEMDGGLHYRTAFGRNKEEIQSIDQYKEQTAIQRGIEVIRIECKKSKPEYIANNILNSKLASIFDLSSFDWNLCERNSVPHSYTEIWNYANEHLDLSTRQIAIYFNKKYDSVRNIIAKGNKLNTCYHIPYDRKNIRIGVILCQENLSFISIAQCIKYIKDKYSINVSSKHIHDCCDNIISDYRGFTFCYAD